MRGWRYYLPDSGETADDASDIPGKIYDADDAAYEACKLDYSDRDGWERGDAAFPIIVIDPNGKEHHYQGSHEPDVYHSVSAVDAQN